MTGLNGDIQGLWGAVKANAASRRSLNADTEAATVRIVLKTTDPVRLSFAEALLRDAGIEAVVLDAYISAVEGSIGAFPRRLAVGEADAAEAAAILKALEALDAAPLPPEDEA